MWYLLKKLLNIEYKVSTPVSHIGLETPNISNKKISLQFVEAGHEISKYLSQFSPDCVREFMKMNFYFFFFLFQIVVRLALNFQFEKGRQTEDPYKV